MANELIEVARLDIDTSLLVKSAGDAKLQLEGLKEEQKLLTTEIKKGGDGAKKASEDFVKNELKIKDLAKTYRDASKAILEQEKRMEDLEGATEALERATRGEINSINEARGNISLLTKLRNETNTSTKEGKARILELNSAIDANNDYIKDNADEYLKLKLNIGAYSDSIKEALGDVNLFNGGLMDFVSRSNEAGGAGEVLKKSFTGVTAGIGGMIKASLAFIATPLGAILATIAVTVGLLVGAFKFMVSSMKSTEEGSNKLAKVMAIFDGIVNALGKALKPVAEFLFNVFAKALETVISIAETGIEIFTSLARAMGFDGVADGIEEAADAVRENIALAQQLADEEAKLQKMQREARLIQLQYQKDAEKLRQTRDDITKSDKERFEAVTQLGALLKKQALEELAIAKQQLLVADLKIKAEGESTELLDKRAEALTNIADIQERITGQESEQLTSLNALRKEIDDRERERRQKALDDAIAKQKQLLALFVAQNGDRAKTLDEQIRYEQQISNKSIAILKKELNAKKISQIEYDTQIIVLRQGQLQRLLDLTNAYARLELEEFIEMNRSKLDSYKSINGEVIDEENRRLQVIRDRNIAYLAQEKGVNEQIVLAKKANNEALTIAETEFLLERLRLNNEYTAQEIANERSLKEAERARKLEQLAIDNELARARAVEGYALQVVEEEQRHAEELERYRLLHENLKLTDEEYNEFVRLENDKTAKIKQQNALANAEKELGAMQSVSDAIGEAFGQSKELATAQALMSGSQAVMSILAGTISGNPLVDSIIKAVLIGTTVVKTGKQISEINKAKKPSQPKFRDGGIFKFGGKRHAGGGTKFTGDDGSSFEAESGEIGILNRNASAQFMAFNDAFKGNDLASLSSSGGVISDAVKTGDNTSDIARIVVEAVSSLPAPVVTVEDINYQQTRTAEVISAGDL